MIIYLSGKERKYKTMNICFWEFNKCNVIKGLCSEKPRIHTLSSNLSEELNVLIGFQGLNDFIQKMLIDLF